MKIAYTFKIKKICTYEEKNAIKRNLTMIMYLFSLGIGLYSRKKETILKLAFKTYNIFGLSKTAFVQE